MKVIGFGFFSPIGTVAYVYEHLFGLSHNVAKAIHFTFQTAALIFATLGIYDMWLVHDKNNHMQTLHSWSEISVVRRAGIFSVLFSPHPTPNNNKLVYLGISCFLSSGQ